ncbi:hypothetical protein CHI08_16945 [Peribacillus simplex]|nr:hypothetical protein CHI08_16945 [Peribacillus simplex]
MKGSKLIFLFINLNLVSIQMFEKFLQEITGVSKITAGLLILLLKFSVRNGYLMTSFLSPNLKFME